jgi:glutathione S-transferase
VIRVHRIPFSTNVERVEIAAAFKGVAVEWVDHDPDDRSALVALSGQGLVPVAEFGHDVVRDSMRIVERLEAEAAEPPLYPADPAERALLDTFVDWFNEVWKVPPNALEEPGVSGAERAELAARMRAWTPRFEALLCDRDFLLGDRLGTADVCAFPFLRYAVDEPDPADGDGFHVVLGEHLSADGLPRLREWIERVRAVKAT